MEGVYRTFLLFPFAPSRVIILLETMIYTCPQCGAHHKTPETCEDRFNTSQLLELEKPEYHAVHHLSVLCYMLQHNLYSREGWLLARELMYQFVYRGLTPAMARRQNLLALDGEYRNFSITRGPKLPGVEEIMWDRTIADVRLTSADLYCADVLNWAKSVLALSEKLVRESAQSSDEYGDE